MSPTRRPVVLIISRYYLPGVNAGGPVASLANIVERLGAAFDFRVVAPDTDVGESTPYPNVRSDAWQAVGAASVYYLRGRPGLQRMKALIASVRPDAIYLNSFFSFSWTLLPLLAIGAGPRRATCIVAPRGELSPGAIEIKGWKKLPYVAVARRLGLYRGVLFQATDETEAAAIRDRMGQDSAVRVVCNLPTVRPGDRAQRRSTTSDSLRVVFLSRIHPKKNLAYALDVLARVDAPVELTIAGPIERSDYWRECRNAIDALPGHVRASHVGRVAREDVPGLLADHDLFFLPTRSENFGHVIYEALSVGTPVLISDQTPWRGLARRRAGWDLPLDDPTAFADAVQAAATWDLADRSRWRAGAREVAAEYERASENAEETRELFAEAVRRGRPVDPGR